VIENPLGATFNYQITKFSNYPIGSCVAMVLRLHVAGFTAWATVILAVFAESDVVLRPAKPTILCTGAASLNLVAHDANEIFGHGRELS
jgi:hypothetical protein